MSIKVDPDWWKEIFDDIYLITDSRSVCNDEITSHEVDLICSLLKIEHHHSILDLCGGHGRHSLELAARGFRHCTLLDYSKYLIQHAKDRAAKSNHQLHFVQTDARDSGLPDASFDRIIIMGNSLGYVPESEADREILAEANRLLKPHGCLLIDVIDGAAARESFNPNSWHEIGSDILVCRQRELHQDRVCAREVVVSKEKGLIRDRTYSIRLYDAESIQAMLEQLGFENIRLHSEFSVKKSGEDCGFMNLRMIATAQKI